MDVNIIGPAGQALDNQGRDHEESHDHASEHEEHEGHSESIKSHSEVSALYVFTCDNEELESVTTSLFEHFSKLEKIQVDWVTDTQQGQNILQASSATVRIK